LYVAEAGSGGNGTCIPAPDNPNQQRCYGETGALTRIDPTGATAPVRVVKDLPSMAAPGGFAASSGPVDVSFFGMNAFVLMGWGGNPGLRANAGAKSSLFGTLLRVLPNGSYRSVDDVSQHELVANPAGGPIDSNPYGVAALPGRQVVADAGANAVLEVRGYSSAEGVKTLAVLPRTGFGVEPVPTSVTEGPDGYLYVSQLTGAPFFRGSASIFRIAPNGGPAEVYVAGLTAVVDMAFSPDGTLYILEIASGLVPGPGANPGVGAGRLLRKPVAGAPEVVLDHLVFPAGVAVGPDGSVYLTNFGVFPSTGQVLRVAFD
jgi:glucose/arabinose dehydrogenase